MISTIQLLFRFRFNSTSWSSLLGILRFSSDQGRAFDPAARFAFFVSLGTE